MDNIHRTCNVYVYIYSILFGYLYSVIRINVVECFFANPSQNWTIQRFARVAEKERTQQKKYKI